MRALAIVMACGTLGAGVCNTASASVVLGQGIDGITPGEPASSVRHHLGLQHGGAPGREWRYDHGALRITFDRRRRVLLVGTLMASQKTPQGIHTVRYTNVGPGLAKAPQLGTGSTEAQLLETYPTVKCGPGPTIDGVTQQETRCQLLSRLHNRQVETTFTFYAGSSIAVHEVDEIFVGYTHE